MNEGTYTVILVRSLEAAGAQWLSVLVPAMPGCVTQGRTREEALASVREAMALWLECEAEQGRGPLPQTPGLVLAGVAEAMQIIDDMRAAGELPRSAGYDFEVAQASPLNQPVGTVAA